MLECIACVNAVNQQGNHVMWDDHLVAATQRTDPMQKMQNSDAPRDERGANASGPAQGSGVLAPPGLGAARSRANGKLECATLQVAPNPEVLRPATTAESPWLSASIITAVVLFIAREVWTTMRDNKRRRQTTLALKVLLAEETEKNYWAFKRTFAVLEGIRDLDSSMDRTAGAWVDRSGTMHATFTPVGESEPHASLALFPYATARYERLADKVAEFDRELFGSVQAFYHEVAKWKHELAILERYLSGQDDGPFADRAATQAFLADLCAEETQRDENFKLFHKRLVAIELKPRVR